tara:strand:+ start:391 stop:612 length:222 start_codon:yes stop_codon:yes gene_type:complete
MDVDILSEDDVERIALSKVCDHIKDDEWCEDGSVRMDIKVLQKQVKSLQKQAHITTEVVTTMAEMIEMLERKI